MFQDFKIPQEGFYDKEYFNRVIKAIDTKRTEDLPLHAWNLGHLHTKWDDWPPKSWSSFPNQRKKLLETDHRYTYTFDFLTKVKFPAEERFISKKTLDPFDPECDMFYFSEKRCIDLQNELSICFERAINSTIYKINNFERDVLIKQRFEKMIRNHEHDKVTPLDSASASASDSDSDSEEVEYVERDDLFDEISKCSDFEYRRSTLDDIEMPKAYKANVLRELDDVIDDLINTRLKQVYHSDDKEEPPILNWRDVLTSIFNTTSKPNNSTDSHHFKAKESILKLFSVKLNPPPKPLPDPHFELNDDKMQTEDANVVLWKQNMKRLNLNDQIETNLKATLELDRHKSELKHKESTVPLVDFSNAVLDHVRKQAHRSLYRKKWLDDFNKLDKSSTEFFNNLRDDIPFDDIETNKQLNQEIISNFRKRKFDELKEPTHEDFEKYSFTAFKRDFDKENIYNIPNNYLVKARSPKKKSKFSNIDFVNTDEMVNVKFKLKKSHPN